MRGKHFANFAIAVAIAKLLRRLASTCLYLHSPKSASGNFYAGIQSRVQFAKFFPRVTFPAYGSEGSYNKKYLVAY